MAAKPKWRQQFSAIARLVKVKHSAKEIFEWIHNYKPVFPSFLSFLPFLFSIISLTLMVLVGVDMLPFNILVIWFLLVWELQGYILKK